MPSFYLNNRVEYRVEKGPNKKRNAITISSNIQRNDAI